MVERNRIHDDDNAPLFVISIAARMVGMHAQSLRHYERLGLIRPSRSRGRVRLYSQADIERLRHIQRLVNDLGVNLAGAEVVIRLNERIRRMEEEMERLRAELQETRATLMACFMFVHKTLYWLDRRGILHSHTDEGGLKDGS